MYKVTVSYNHFIWFDYLITFPLQTVTIQSEATAVHVYPSESKVSSIDRMNQDVECPLLDVTDIGDW